MAKTGVKSCLGPTTDPAANSSPPTRININKKKKKKTLYGEIGRPPGQA